MHKKDLQTTFSTRQFMYSEDFEVYYYSDLPLKAVSPHTHNYYEFYFFLEGNVDIHVEDKTYHIKNGDFLLIPPHVTHYPVFLDHTTPYRRFILWISTDYCNRLMESSLDYGYLLQNVTTTHNYSFSNDVITFNRIQSQIFELIEEVKSNRFGRDAKIALQVNSLLLYLNRLIYERSHMAGASSEKELHLAICDFINNHLEEDLSLERLEKEFFVKFFLNKKFLLCFSTLYFSLICPILKSKYISKKRLQACRSAIASGASISSTYELYGFSDYSAFFRAFKKEYGLSPKEYRDMTTLLS